MINSELRSHQWKAFKRHPAFERNMTIKVLMFITFGFIALYLLMLGLMLDIILLEIGAYQSPVDSFNSLLHFVFMADFAIKLLIKSNQSMQIAPYLALPVKRNRLFNFLLMKEFSSPLNYYLLFTLVPFALKVFIPAFGVLASLLYLAFIWLMCIAISLLVSWINYLARRNFLFYGIALVCIAAPLVAQFVLKFKLDETMQHFGELILTINPFVWIGLAAAGSAFWYLNLLQMRESVYNELEGERISKVSSLSQLSFLERFGTTGDYIMLEIKMILRSKRLKNIIIAYPLPVAYFMYMVYSPDFLKGGRDFIFLMYGILSIGMFGITMGQFIFTAESSFFDGMASRRGSIFEMLRSKYIFYSICSTIITILFLIPVFQGKMSLLFLFALFFYTIGPIYFMMFQNAVYNKTYIDLFDKGMMNWKGQSGSMFVIAVLAQFIPVVSMLIMRVIWGETFSLWVMLFVGASFVITSQSWLKWTYGRFLKRKYRNMEGFRSN
ncbi:MAG: DUF5687 family protein [Prevotellaceae bacterium]|jgi:hypothetical protein|nr:DUF5687 family protein [Prevotellaceae bacterium]